MLTPCYDLSGEATPHIRVPETPHVVPFGAAGTLTGSRQDRRLPPCAGSQQRRAAVISAAAKPGKVAGGGDRDLEALHQELLQQVPLRLRRGSPGSRSCTSACGRACACIPARAEPSLADVR